VVGPTAVGKTALAEELAVRLGGEIVSADSMQLYRGMDIGTAKPAPSEQRVPYHCIDLVEPGEPFSAALFQTLARSAIDDITRRGSLPIVAGGTGLYVRAALDRMEFPRGELADNPTRERYERLAAENGPESLHALLAQRDPASAEAIHPNNVRRVVRALEMADEGTSYADQVAGFSTRESVYDARYVGLTIDRDVLYDRIDARVDRMMTMGLLGEVERLLKAGLRSALTATQAIGYKEFVPVIEDGADLDAAVSAVKQASRRYAKRQLSWFRADPRIAWIDVTGMTEEETVTAAIDALDLTARRSLPSDATTPQP
jgi:tRNA dimethylallyltransferase